MGACGLERTLLKGELNLYNKWQSDDLFHIVINDNHPRGNRF